MSEKKLDAIYEKLEKVEDRLGSIDKTLVLHEANLREHMRRSELNEMAIEKQNEAFKPVIKHVTMVESAFKLIGMLSIGLTMVASILKIASFI